MKYSLLGNTGEKLSSIGPYSPLARGFITATIYEMEKLAKDDFRRTVPRFKEEHWKNNQRLVNQFAAFAADKNCTPAQLALAWVLAQGISAKVTVQVQ